MKAIDRVIDVMKDRGLKPSAVERALSLSNGYLATMKKRGGSMTEETLVQLANHLDLSLIFLLTGAKDAKPLPPQNQPTLQSNQVITVDSQGRENAVFVPVKARAGYLSGFSDPSFISTLPAYRMPKLNNKTYRMFETEGYSMYDTLAPGDITICSSVENLADIRDGRVYVFVCDKKKTGEGGIVVKRALNRIDKYGTLILKSDNITGGEYPDIILHPEDIYEAWYVEWYMSNTLRDPRAVYDRLNNIEATLAMHEQYFKERLNGN